MQRHLTMKYIQQLNKFTFSGNLRVLCSDILAFFWSTLAISVHSKVDYYSLSLSTAGHGDDFDNENYICFHYCIYQVSPQTCRQESPTCMIIIICTLVPGVFRKDRMAYSPTESLFIHHRILGFLFVDLTIVHLL